MKIGEKVQALMILIAVLWIVITIMGWTGYWFAAMFLGIILMLIHMSLGCAHEGKLSLRLFLYPHVAWAILWSIGFALSYYYGNLFAGKMPDFTILGFHPSFAWTILTYWIGGVVTLTVGFVVQEDLWLSNEEWKEFKDKIAKINKERGGEYGDIRG